jgi:hypothetical protein
MSNLSTNQRHSSHPEQRTSSKRRRVVVFGIALAVCLQIAFGFFIFRAPSTRSAEPVRKTAHSSDLHRTYALVGDYIAFRGL